jgi:hypothetical protein
MFEYVAFNPYNASPEAMANELTKKSSEGWEVVEILPTFDGRYCAFLRRPVSSTLDSSTALGSSVVTSAPATVATSSSSGSASVPAAWYADPSGRYELRYWNGKEWTEHVARSGQQFTDPPVA